MPGSNFRNRILKALSDSEATVILPRLRAVDLPLGMILREPGTDDRYVYFLESGMASATALSKEGDSIEVGLAGPEGLVGISSLLGHRGLPHRTVMQGSGYGYSIETEIVRSEFLKGGPFTHAVHDFLHAQLVQAAQCALCNRVHEVEPRLARWILAASDIMETAELEMTQEFLSQMIGVGRPYVTVAAGTLKRAGMIDYRRGRLSIVDRPMLEDAACECYAALRSEFDVIYDRLEAARPSKAEA